MQEKSKILSDLTNDIRERLKHRGTNYALLFFGIFMTIFGLFGYYEWILNIDVPAYITAGLRTLVLIFGTYFVAALVIRLSVDLMIKIFGGVEIEKKLLTKRLYSWSIYIVATLFVLYKLGVGLQNITLAATLLTTGLTFILRDVLTSYLAWYILLTKRPFRIGDYIRIGEDEGKVMYIGSFYVLIDSSPHTKDDFVRIPNKLFLEKPIQNFGQNDVLHTIKIYISDVPKDYESRIGKVLKQINKELDVKANAFLDVEGDKRLLRFELRTDYDRKAELRSRIIQITSKMF